MVAGEPGFGFRRGEVWALHVAWSGNHRTLAESTSSGVRLLAGGEVLLPGRGPARCRRVLREPVGLRVVRRRARRHVRAVPRLPPQPSAAPDVARGPVTLNTWEAVYFDQDLDRLTALADAAAEWAPTVRARRRLVRRPARRPGRPRRLVRRPGCLARRAAPAGRPRSRAGACSSGCGWSRRWSTRTPTWPATTRTGCWPRAARLLRRHQLVLDLGHPAAYAHIRQRLHALLDEYPIDYLKWDHNRDLVEAGRAAASRRAAQTLAFYRLLDELQAAHPGLEIESCSSGGGRVDLGDPRAHRPGLGQRLHRPARAPADPALDRAAAPAGAGRLARRRPDVAHHRTHARARLPGRHGVLRALRHRVGPGTATTRGARTARRVGRGTSAARPAAHRHRGQRRPPDPSLWVHGVVAEDRARAVFALVARCHERPGPGRSRPAPRPRPGRVVPPRAAASRRPRRGRRPAALPWWEHGVTLPGRVLGHVGVQAPMLYPERLVLLEVTRVA